MCGSELPHILIPPLVSYKMGATLVKTVKGLQYSCCYETVSGLHHCYRLEIPYYISSRGSTSGYLLVSTVSPAFQLSCYVKVY